VYACVFVIVIVVLFIIVIIRFWVLSWHTVYVRIRSCLRELTTASH
jgi:hypothetical protein